VYSKLPLLLTPLTYIPVGHIDIEVCEKCKGPVKIIACVEDPVAIEKILKHLKEKAVTDSMAQLLCCCFNEY